MRLKSLVQIFGLLALLFIIAGLSHFQAQGAAANPQNASGNFLQATAAATANSAPSITPTPLPTLRSDLMGIQAYAYLGPALRSRANRVVVRDHRPGPR